MPLPYDKKPLSILQDLSNVFHASGSIRDLGLPVIDLDQIPRNRKNTCSWHPSLSIMSVMLWCVFYLQKVLFETRPVQVPFRFRKKIMWLQVRKQCCGFESGIRCLFGPWIRQQNKEIRIRDEYSGSYFRELRNKFWVKNTFFDADLDPGSGIFLTMDMGWKKLGWTSRIRNTVRKDK